MLRVPGGHSVDGAQHELLPERRTPLVLPQILLGYRIFLDADRGLRTGLPDAGRSIGADLGSACAIRGASGSRDSFY